MIRQYIDIPPVWLIGALTLAWLQSTYVTLGLSLDWPIVQFIGGLCVGGGFLLIFLAAIEMWKHKTIFDFVVHFIEQLVYKQSHSNHFISATSASFKA